MSRIKYSIERKIDEIEGKTPENDMQTDKEKNICMIYIYIELVYIYVRKTANTPLFFSLQSHNR